MIFDKIYDIIFSYPLEVLETLKPLSLSTEFTNVLNGLTNFLGNLAYVVPFRRLMPILAISLSLHTLQIAWSFMLRIKSFIPSWGN